jgi:hypothetical protein
MGDRRAPVEGGSVPGELDEVVAGPRLETLRCGGRPAGRRSTIDRDVESLQYCVDRVADRPALAAREEQCHRLVPTLRDDERTRVPARRECIRRHRDLVDEPCVLEAERLEIQVTNIDGHADLGDRSELEARRPPVLLHGLADECRRRRRTRHPVAVPGRRCPNVGRRRDCDGSVDRVRLAVRKVDGMEVMKSADAVRRIAAPVDVSGLNDPVPDARAVDRGIHMVVREREDVRAVRDAGPEGPRGSVEMSGRDTDGNRSRESIGGRACEQNAGGQGLDRDAVQGLGDVCDIWLLLVDTNDGLAVRFQTDADPGHARLVEQLVGVLLLDFLRFIEAGWRALTRRRGRVSEGDE